jgi:hypothetical protein
LPSSRQLPDRSDRPKRIEERAVTYLPQTGIFLASLTVLAAGAGPAAGQPATARPDADFDLDSLVQAEDTGGPGAGAPLVISGFADFSYYVPFYEPDSLWAGAGLPAHDTFWVGNLNVYLAKPISERCRALAEVRFMYEPNGSFTQGATERVDTTAQDHAAVRRPLQLGGIRIERAQVDCELAAWLTVRIGQWLTPYGIWNQDHGSPTIIAIRRPYAVGDELLPEQQTGLMAYGSVARKDLRLGYYLTVSNGRGQTSATEDLDGNKALGGRLELSYGGFGDVTVGASYYRGRFTATKAPRVDLGTGKGIIDLKSQYDEQSFAFDLRWDFRGLALRSELLYNERRYTSAGRATVNGLLFPDTYRQGGYLLLGYRTPWFGIMPYSYAQHVSLPVAPDAWVEGVNSYHFGLNVLLSPAMVFKVEYIHATFSESPIPGIDSLGILEAQISWAF